MKATCIIIQLLHALANCQLEENTVRQQSIVSFQRQTAPLVDGEVPQAIEKQRIGKSPADKASVYRPLNCHHLEGHLHRTGVSQLILVIMAGPTK